MEQSASKEASPAPSERGLKGVLAKARRSRQDNSSTTSISGTDNGSDGHGIRNSVDSLLDKALPIRHSSVDDDGKSTAADKLSKLIPARIKKKRRERKEVERQQDDEERGRSIGDQGGASADHESHSGQQSPGGDGGSSLITMDSDTESPLTTPPPLTSHQSHIGYLTSTSPLIRSNTISAPSASNTDIPTFQPLEYRKSATLPASSNTSSTTNLAPRNGVTLDTRQAEDETSRNGRGVSPGAKIKDVFSGSRKKRASPPTSPDRASAKSSESTTTLGGSLGTADKRKSATFKQSRNVLEDRPPKPQSMDTDTKIQTVKKPDIPNISVIPRTPPSASLDTPLTKITPPTPTDQRAEPPDSPSARLQQTSSAGTNSGNTVIHRRARSDSATHQPSKLSNAMSAPLTPTIEESNTPGARSPGISGSPGGPGGFFSSVFSAAQNAANTLTNTIANNPPRSRSSSQVIDQVYQDNETASTTFEGADDVLADPKKQLAIDTLGSGDLSLHHLGIGTEPSTGNSTSGNFPTALNGSPRGKEGSMIQRDEAAARAEDASAARAVSAAYSDVALNEHSSTPIAEDPAPAYKTRSAYENSLPGDRTPPNGSIFEGESGFKRSGSVRSRVGAVARRHRNSSGATGSTIAAAIGAGHSALANPAASGSTPKLTGFAVASKKRNRDFHQLFRSVPEDDYLIEDYSCALQRDIILAGRIYVSEGHICFSSNILGWVTTLIISFDEVVSVEKENTAMVFPNAIAIQTLHARHTFRSLLSREATYELLIGIWKLSHPQLKSSLNGVTLDTGGTGDKTEKAEPSSEDASDLSEEEEEVYDEDEEVDEGIGSFTEAGEGSATGSDVGEPVSKPAIRKASSMGNAIGTAAGSVPTNSDAKNGEKAAIASAASVDFPGPATHAPTECTDGDTHYDKVLKDEVIPAPLGKVYSMIFGPASGGFMTKWLLDDVKVTELQMEDDKKGLDNEVKSRSYSYIKPLYASIGPKSTKCLIVENMDSFDLEKAVSVTVSTQTPDVPSGNVFTTKTKFCLMWAPGNSTRLLMNFTIEWSGKSWLKGPIEKGASDGQGTYANDLVKALKLGLSSRSRANTLGSKLKFKGGKRRKGDADASKASLTDTSLKTAVVQKQDISWGVLEPLHGLLGPVVDPIMTLINSHVIIGFLLITLLVTWYRRPTLPATSLRYPGMPTPERMAAYEEIWRAEESELWSWLEERIGMDGLAYPVNARKEEGGRRERNVGMKGVRARLAEEKMKEREVDEAIRVTEERLAVLKGVVGRKKEDKVKAKGKDGKGAQRSGEVRDEREAEDEGYSSGNGNKGTTSDEL